MLRLHCVCPEFVGFASEAERQAARMVDFNAYKRRQSPPGVRITPKAFGKDRRMPLTNRYEFPKKSTGHLFIPT